MAMSRAVLIGDSSGLEKVWTEDFRRTYDVTRNPVERLTAQNRVRNPDELTLTGRLSAHPINSPLELLGVARLDRRELAKLRTLIDAADPVFIVTPERSYKNMVCVSHQEHYDETTGQGVALTMTFVEIQIATPGLVDSVLDTDMLGVGAGTTDDMGAQTPETVADDPLTGNGAAQLSATEKSALVANSPELDGVLL